jgi:hypothetical protein
MNYKQFRNSIENYGIEHKLMLIKKLIIELRARDKYEFYSYDPRRTNTDKYVKFHECDSRIKIVKGSQRSGKTYMVIKECYDLLLDSHPYIKLLKRKDIKYNMWVVAPSFGKIGDDLLPLFRRLLPMNRVKYIVEDQKNNKYRIEFDNGARILFKSQEQNIKEFGTAEVYIVLCDEDVSNPDIRVQLRTRIITTGGRMYFTMDASREDAWIDSFREFDNVTFFEFNLMDNIDYIPNIDEFKQLSQELSDVDKIRILEGRYAERDIKPIFEPDVWNDSNYLYIDPNRFNIHFNTMDSAEDGLIRIFVDRKPGVKYVLGFDSAKGTGLNSNSGQMLSDTGEQCALFMNNDIHFTKLPDILREFLIYYNTALFVPENKSYNYYIINTLNINYKHIYIDGYYKPFSKSSKELDFGIMTSESNKTEMINQTCADIMAGKILIHDEITKAQLECLMEDTSERDSQKKNVKYKFIKSDNLKSMYGKYPELKKSHGDNVLSLCFADRALNMLNYFNNSNRRIVKKQTQPQSIDELLLMKVYRPDNINKNNYWRH